MTGRRWLAPFICTEQAFVVMAVLLHIVELHSVGKVAKVACKLNSANTRNVELRNDPARRPEDSKEVDNRQGDGLPPIPNGTRWDAVRESARTVF
jgi:hypothetical protein